MITLICPECRRENEAERIYCHDCGARLDRTALAKIAPKGEDVKDTQRRLRTMLNPQRAKMRLLFFKVSKLILGALATAAVVQMILPPDVPPRAKTGEFPPQINLDLENAAMSHGAAPLQYTEAQANAYRITAERSLFGYSFFTTTAARVTLENGTLISSNNGGSIGRLPIHPLLMKY